MKKRASLVLGGRFAKMSSVSLIFCLEKGNWMAVREAESSLQKRARSSSGAGGCFSQACHVSGLFMFTKSLTVRYSLLLD